MKFFEILIPRRRRLKVVAATGNNYPTKSKAMATEEQTRTKLTGSQDTLQNKERQSFLKYVFVKKKHRDSKKDEVAIERISNEIANWVKNKIKQEHLGEEESVESFFEDENDYFYRSMALISKRLPKEDQANIRLQLCKLITDAETKSRLASEQADVKSISIQPKTTVPETKNSSEQFQEIKQSKTVLQKERVNRQRGKLEEEESPRTVTTAEVEKAAAKAAESGSVEMSFTSSEGIMESSFEHKGTQN